MEDVIIAATDYRVIGGLAAVLDGRNITNDFARDSFELNDRIKSQDPAPKVVVMDTSFENPLKTCQEIHKKRPEVSLLYLTSEKFKQKPEFLHKTYTRNESNPGRVYQEIYQDIRRIL